MKTKTVLILGGKDKGNDYTEIEDLVREKCSALVYLGLHNEKLHDFFDRMGLPVADVQTGMKDAVDAAFRNLEPDQKKNCIERKILIQIKVPILYFALLCD